MEVAFEISDNRYKYTEKVLGFLKINKYFEIKIYVSYLKAYFKSFCT